jgi:hypothetical protein
MDFGDRCFDTATLFDGQVPFQRERFMASLIVFPSEPQVVVQLTPRLPNRAGLAPHFIVPA